MWDFGSAVNAQIATGKLHVRTILTVEARNKATGALEELNLWSGLGRRDFTTEGVTRTHAGSGRILSVKPPKGGVGLRVQRHTVALSSIPSDVADLIATYDARLAPVRVYEVHFDPIKGVVIGDPYRIIKGRIDLMPVPTATGDGTANLRVKIASASRVLTQTVPMFQSDAMQRTVDAADDGMEYAIAQAPVWWGGVKEKGIPPPTAPGRDSSADTDRGQNANVDTGGPGSGGR